MDTQEEGLIAVIFTSVRTQDDQAGYDRAAADMERLAAAQPGYRGFVSSRGPDGPGISVSYWADEAAAKAWRDHPAHVAIRDLGRSRWYSAYRVDIARVERSYNWTTDGKRTSQ